MPQTGLDTRTLGTETPASSGLRFPKLAGTPIYYFRACGRIVSKAPEQEGKEVARYGRKEGQTFVRFVYGRLQDEARHVHFDLMRRDGLEDFDMEPPATTATLANIRRLYADYAELSASVMVTAYLRVKIEEVASSLVFVGPNAVNTRVGHVTVGVSGAHLAFSGSEFVRGIEWEIIGDGLLCIIEGRLGSADNDEDEAHGSKDTLLDDDYLIRLFARTTLAMNRYILGRVPDASR